jgi:hypothetical protein
LTDGIRRTALVGFLIVAGAAQAGEAVELFKSDSCACCSAWGKHMQENGFAVSEQDIPLANLMAMKSQAGLKEGQTSCHTAKIGGYVIEGHVPAREVKRLLSEQPDAIGLTVPDMPYGSPGMGEAGDDADPYDVLLVKRDGSTEIYVSYR